MTIELEKPLIRFQVRWMSRFEGAGDDPLTAVRDIAGKLHAAGGPKPGTFIKAFLKENPDYIARASAN